MRITFIVGNTPTLIYCLTFGGECVIFYETDFELRVKKSCEFNLIYECFGYLFY